MKFAMGIMRLDRLAGFVFGLLLMLVLFVLPLMSASPAAAAEFERVIITGTTAGTYSNATPFYNAQVQGVRVVNLAGASVTNTIVVSQVVASGALTNQMASLATPTSAFQDVTTNRYVQLATDVFRVAATSNFLVEITLDNRGR
jgi:hypothetical protein